MDELLNLISQNSSLKTSELAARLNCTEQEVTAKIRDYEDQKIILGYHAIMNEEAVGRDHVRAVIEVKITPEREGGFNRLAQRISKFPEVRSCYLMSGGYDLMVIIEGTTLQEVALFVSEKLATIEGVLSTSTHFLLKAYKEQGILIQSEEKPERLAVAP